MDLVYCIGGQWHIIDYKTNADGSDLDIKYKNQLAAYVKAFKEITGNYYPPNPTHSVHLTCSKACRTFLYYKQNVIYAGIHTIFSFIIKFLG